MIAQGKHLVRQLHPKIKQLEALSLEIFIELSNIAKQTQKWCLTLGIRLRPLTEKMLACRNSNILTQHGKFQVAVWVFINCFFPAVAQGGQLPSVRSPACDSQANWREFRDFISHQNLEVYSTNCEIGSCFGLGPTHTLPDKTGHDSALVKSQVTFSKGSFWPLHQVVYLKTIQKLHVPEWCFLLKYVLCNPVISSTMFSSQFQG